MKIGDLIKASQDFIPCGYGIIIKLDGEFIKVYWFDVQMHEWLHDHHIEVINEDR